MKKILVSLLIFVLLGGQVVSYAQDKAQYNGFEAKVIKIKKDVEYRKANDWWKFWKWEDLTSETKLKAGALLKVGADSQLELEFINGTRVLVKANSNLEIVNGEPGKNKSSYFRKQSLELNLGEVWVKTIESLSEITRFEVRTPNAVAGVKGTLFNVKVNPKKETEVRVEEGRVSVANDDEGRTISKQQKLKVDKDGGFGKIKRASDEREEVKPWMEDIEEWVEEKKRDIEDEKERWEQEEQDREDEIETKEEYEDDDQYEEQHDERDRDDNNRKDDRHERHDRDDRDDRDDNREHEDRSDNDRHNKDRNDDNRHDDRSYDHDSRDDDRSSHRNDRDEGEEDDDDDE